MTKTKFKYDDLSKLILNGEALGQIKELTATYSHKYIEPHPIRDNKGEIDNCKVKGNLKTIFKIFMDRFHKENPRWKKGTISTIPYNSIASGEYSVSEGQTGILLWKRPALILTGRYFLEGYDNIITIIFVKNK